MDNTTQIKELQSIIGQRQNELDILNAVLVTLTDGYKSDQTAIDVAISDAKQSLVDQLASIQTALVPSKAQSIVQ